MANTKKTSIKATSGLGSDKKESKTTKKSTTTKKAAVKKEVKPVVKKETKKTTAKKETTKKVVAVKAKKEEPVKKETTKKVSTIKKEEKVESKKVAKTSTTKSDSKEKNETVKPTKVFKTGSSSNAPLKYENKHYSSNRHFKKRIKFCKLCAKGIEHVDYKDVELLSKHLSYNLKILSKKSTNTCTSHQRRISNAIKRARLVALIPYIKD